MNERKMELLPGMNKKPKLTIANVFDRDNAKKGLAKNLSFGMTRTSENAKKDIGKNIVIIELQIKKICSDDIQYYFLGHWPMKKYFLQNICEHPNSL